MAQLVAEALADVRARLATAGVPTPDVDAELLARHVTGWSRARLLTAGAQTLPTEAAARLHALAVRRASREPLQLLVGTVGFRHIELEVRPGVFIPRPETETLAGEAIVRLPPAGIALDACTGTGAVACAVADEVPGARVVATDISAAAVDLARTNVARLGLAVDVEQGDLLAPVAPVLRGRVDVLVSNPPYLAEVELAGLEPEVLDHDPHAALVAGPAGNEVVHRLIDAALLWLRPGGWLVLEVADVRASQTRGRCQAAGLDHVVVVPDLAGRDRVVVARRPAGSSSLT